MDSAVPRSVAGSVLLILILSLPLYLVHLGRTGLSDPDEPFYAVPAHEMMDSGTYDVPVFHGRPWFDKPILFYWIVMTAFLLFGVSEASARIGSVLAAAGGLLAVFALGRRVCRHPMGPLGAAIVLATSFEYVILARAASPTWRSPCSSRWGCSPPSAASRTAAPCRRGWPGPHSGSPRSPRAPSVPCSPRSL